MQVVGSNSGNTIAETLLTPRSKEAWLIAGDIKDVQTNCQKLENCIVQNQLQTLPLSPYHQGLKNELDAIKDCISHCEQSTSLAPSNELIDKIIQQHLKDIQLSLEGGIEQFFQSYRQSIEKLKSESSEHWEQLRATKDTQSRHEERLSSVTSHGEKLKQHHRTLASAHNSFVKDISQPTKQHTKQLDIQKAQYARFVEELRGDISGLQKQANSLLPLLALVEKNEIEMQNVSAVISSARNQSSAPFQSEIEQIKASLLANERRTDVIDQQLQQQS
ncbi:MAG: hypothetical protein Q9180_002093 [Flavoplaca navasiana]